MPRRRRDTLALLPLSSRSEYILQVSLLHTVLRQVRWQAHHIAKFESHWSVHSIDRFCEFLPALDRMPPRGIAPLAKTKQHLIGVPCLFHSHVKLTIAHTPLYPIAHIETPANKKHVSRHACIFQSVFVRMCCMHMCV